MNGIGLFVKDNLWKIMVLSVGLIITWTVIQGTVKMNTNRIAKAEIKIESLEEAVVRVIILEENEKDIEECLAEIKGTLKEMDDKLDRYILEID